LVGGFVLFVVITAFHPTGQEDNHPVIFAKYASSKPWVAVHFGQFAGTLLILAGILVLYRVLELRSVVPVLAKFALGSAIVTAAMFAALQAVDGITLKQAVDAWANTSGPQKAIRFADAETVRWTEWGLNSYYKLMFGLTAVLFGAAIARTAIVYRWLGWVGMLGGLLFMAAGVVVGYDGLQSGFEDAAANAAQLLFAIFAVGVLVAGVRRKDLPAAAPGR
jgi:hypothetical protein